MCQNFVRIRARCFTRKDTSILPLKGQSEVQLEGLVLICVQMVTIYMGWFCFIIMVVERKETMTKVYSVEVKNYFRTYTELSTCSM